MHRRSRRIARVLLALLPLLLLCDATAFAQTGARNKPDERRGYLGPQLARTGAGSVVMSWVRPVSGGHDLLLARRAADGALEDPRRLNVETGSVRYLPLDEARPLLVTGPGDEVAVVWFDTAGHLQAVVSEDGARDFGGPYRVDAGPGRPEHAFAGADFARDGSLHVAWLDARKAPAGLEEPALLLLNRVTKEGAGRERDLTSQHTASVCGCCRPFVHVDRSGIEVLFRNTDPEGWRDIHRIRGSFDGEFGTPERIGPATWRIEGCPMAGPISDGAQALWRDGSTGRVRIVAGTSPTAALSVVLAADDANWTAVSPRWVDSDDERAPMLLVPGEPKGRLLAQRGGRWEVVVPDMPAWCHSALVLKDQLLMVGDEHGKLRLEALNVTW